MKARVLGRLYLMASSTKLTFAILVYSVFLVFGMTLMQNHIGIAAAQSRYVESFFFLASPFYWSDSWLSVIKIPLAGGALIGALAVVNLMTSCMRHARFGVQGFGVSITHMALVLLIVSGALQYFMRVEGTVFLRGTTPTNMVFLDSRDNSLKPILLPFTITLENFTAENWEGSNIPKKFSSDIVFQRGDVKEKAIVSVNSPVSFGGWTFFQASFSDGGKTSEISAVRNPARLLPWLSVYAAFFGMIIIFLPRLFGRKGENYED